MTLGTIEKNSVDSDLVRYSRAGDVFHYRWAARRCLRMINPRSTIKCIVIEGSIERKLAGEYVIDVAEYSGSDESNNKAVSYFQLKHSTKKVNDDFILSDFKNTIKGFADRFRDLSNEQNKSVYGASVKFAIVTNRSISQTVKSGFNKVSNGIQANRRFQNTLKSYTKLNNELLKRFCGLVSLIDSEGDCNEQKTDLHFELLQLVAGHVENSQIDSLIALVQEKALPGTQGNIVREEVLKRLGVPSERDLFPAPPEFEVEKDYIERQQHDSLLSYIINASNPIVIHAHGGVGKSVVCRQLATSLPLGSVGVVYDCFGAGKYRNRSQPRHRHRDALVQICNEIAINYDLCETLVPQLYATDDAYLRAFLLRISNASRALQTTNKDAILVILIDAADNAEMAADEFSEHCFANQLLREQLPTGCRIVFTSRTERIHLLKPLSTTNLYELEPFSLIETLAHIREYHPQASEEDGLEFQRLTFGNPRVQANALSIPKITITEILARLGPQGTTVDDQIALQLDLAISNLKDSIPAEFQKSIDAICLGLANLQPFIPINVLATIAEVNEAAVVSFISDLGRPLWLSDNSVQFRDEPTETWFRQKFSASNQQIELYIQRLKPFASQLTYVAEALPLLLLQSDNYDELIRLALSEDSLPDNNPIDKRNILVSRLQFAFKAALKQKRYSDAAKLALRGGEEVAGDKRQLELLSSNTDLIAPLQTEQRVQELAFRRMLAGGWAGSENCYSAALLSSVEAYKGEARSFLRSAENWLQIYFQDRDKSKSNSHDEVLQDQDIVALAMAHFNLFGVKRLIDFLMSWKPPEVTFRIGKLFINRLIDAGEFKKIFEISKLGCHSPYLMIAIADELIKVGKYPPQDAMLKCLDLLLLEKNRIPKPDLPIYQDRISSSIISFAESCLAVGLPREKILKLLEHYYKDIALYSVINDYQDGERTLFLKQISLMGVIKQGIVFDLESLIPKKLHDSENNLEEDRDAKKFKEVIGRLLPWYIVRAQILAGHVSISEELIETVKLSSGKANSNIWLKRDSTLSEITRIHFEILLLSKVSIDRVIDNFTKEYSGSRQFQIGDLLIAVRSACRSDHLSKIRGWLEQFSYEVILRSKELGPENKAALFIDLARAVLPISRLDAGYYFNFAIESVSKFGDEIVERWEALVALANRAADGKEFFPETAYRFIRCAELIGENVAREKHFHRNEAIEVCMKLDPASAFSALSRWRDRDVGWFNRQIVTLAHEAVSSNIIAPAVGCSLTSFSWEYGFIEFTHLCLEYESDSSRRQVIFDMAVRDLQLKGISENDSKMLGELSQKYLLTNWELQQALDFYSIQTIEKNEGSHKATNSVEIEFEPSNIDYEKFLGTFDLSNSKDLSLAIEQFDSLSPPRNTENFWKKIIEKIKPDTEIAFLHALINTEKADIYDIKNALSNIPDRWLRKVSFYNEWPKIIKLIAKKFAAELTNRYTLKYFIENSKIEELFYDSIREGVLEGLSESSNLASASTLFGFPGVVTPFITSQEALNGLDYALSRFESHIEEDFADGKWADWLMPPSKICNAFAGFVWSALGSPRSEIRWQAAHCVRKLAETNCISEIDALIECMESDSVGAFGSQIYPFYNLHARQYLLISFARVAIDIPQILIKHHAVFAKLALKGTSHAIIQKFAAEIAMSMENVFPGTYHSSVCEELQKVGISQIPIKNIESYSDKKTKTIWHSRGEVDLNLKLHFSWDFDRYWYAPLADVFNISVDQIMQLAREVVLKEWQVPVIEEFIRDPRDLMWSSNSYERETSHSQGSYPRTDDYSFYLSYHSMHVVAANLLKSMPIVHHSPWQANSWAEWFQRHSLTRSDGRWLADRRDAIPLKRRSWVNDVKKDEWRWEVMQHDFLDVLFAGVNSDTWLNIGGHWNEIDNSREETITISSALVSQEKSTSLLNALSTSKVSWDAALPEFQDNYHQISTPFYKLEGWIYKDQASKYLDDYDSQNGDIDYPPYKIGQPFIQLIGISPDVDFREWRLLGSIDPSILCNIWSEGESRENREKSRSGNKIMASLNIITTLCSMLKLELIIKVRIERRLIHASYERNSYDSEYSEPYFKFYILSEDGTLRDSRTSYQIR